MPYSPEQLAELRKQDKKAIREGKARVDMSQVPVTEKRPDHGKPRPKPVTVEPTPVGFKVPMKDSPLPLRYFEAHKNAASESCCKELDNLEVQYFKTSPELSAPDAVVIECSVCGRKHRRSASGRSRIAAQ